jgi:mRNA interferase MazF
MVKCYTPERGDIIRIEFTPQKAKEQAGTRPALVLSPRIYNEKIGLSILCPITTVQKGYPFEVSLPAKLKTHGVILSDHIRNFDWRSRNARFIEKAPKETLKEALQKVTLLLQ